MASPEGTANNDALFSLAYEELRRIAHRLHHQSGSSTLSPTALVHEAYVKLSKSRQYQAETLNHLRYTVVRAMKQILFDAARRRAAAAHGGGASPARHVPLDDVSAHAASIDPTQLLLMELALDRLAARNELQARVFDLQFFGGLQVAEIAQTIGSSEKQAQRLLRMARAALAVELAPSDESSGNLGV